MYQLLHKIKVQFSFTCYSDHTRKPTITFFTANKCIYTLRGFCIVGQVLIYIYIYRYRNIGMPTHDDHYRQIKLEPNLDCHPHDTYAKWRPKLRAPDAQTSAFAIPDSIWPICQANKTRTRTSWPNLIHLLPKSDIDLHLWRNSKMP